ncbi:MAG: serine hydrolase domain-containing protein [Vicinamibacterales bacterium]
MNGRLIALGLCLVAGATAGAQDPLVATMDRLATELLRSTRTPGVAVVLVRNDSVVLARGYGRRSIAAADAVDGNTLFAVGSFTKGVTAAALVTLVDQGRLRWDDPVRQHLPAFHLSDSWISEHVTVRDIASIRAGLSGADSILTPTRSPQQVLARSAELPATEFRTGFGLAPNFSFFVAGELAAAVGSRSWEDLVRERLLAPLGMTSTTPRLAVVLASNNLARPHARRGDSIVLLEPQSYEHAIGAGSLYSNAADIGNWLRLQLGRGRFNGQQIISEASMREMHTPHVVSAGGTYQGMFNRHASMLGYGLGWLTSDYRGRKVIEHGGVNGAYTAYIVFLPRENIGFAVLTNLNQSAVWNPIQDMKFTLLDAVIGPAANAVRP